MQIEFNQISKKILSIKLTFETYNFNNVMQWIKKIWIKN